MKRAFELGLYLGFFRIQTRKFEKSEIQTQSENQFFFRIRNPAYVLRILTRFGHARGMHSL